VAVPASASAACEVGQVSGDATYFYYCYASSSWGRIQKSSW